MAKQLANILMQPVNVESLTDLIDFSVDIDEEFNNYVEIKRVKDGDPVAFIGELQAIGKKGAGCDPKFDDITIRNAMKRWTLGDWQAPLKLCYEDLLGTVAEYCLKNGTEIADLTNVEFTTKILLPRISDALKKMIWRLGWFGDTAAKNVTGGGTITDGVDLDLFTSCDGLWKRIFAQCTANASQLTAIAANAKTTAADRKAAIMGSGVATGIFDNMLMDADSRIVDDPSAIILCTRALGNALSYDVKQVHHVIMPWEKVFDGVDVTTYHGVKVASVSVWDRTINAFEKGANVVNKPYRAVFANKKQLMVGCPADSLISDINIWYEKKERREYIDIMGKLGTNLLEEDMFQAAY